MIQIGPVELAAVGISIAIFNQASKIAIFPLVSITTSFVAEEEATGKFIDVEAPEGEELEKGFAVNKELEMAELAPLVGNFSPSCNSFYLVIFILTPEFFVNVMFFFLFELDPACQSSSVTNGQPEMLKLEHVKRHIPSASSAMVIGSVLGLIQALFLILAAKPILNYMGVDSVSTLFYRDNHVTFSSVIFCCLPCAAYKDV